EKLPARKYAVNTCDIELTRKASNLADLTLTFNCFKGFSESLYTSTVPFEYSEEAWGIGLNLPEGDNLQYVFSDEAIFNIYNPSDMRINPRFHPLSIALTCDSVTGQNVRIYNRTNGTLFELKKTIKKADVLLLDGVYPYLNDARCGIDTNHGLITLERGWNRVQIINATNTTIAFDFPFYYR
ncbi:phage tail family protein, partial [Listeria welshimeri]|nr:phage tail family protein [Listeria welshimeri]